MESRATGVLRSTESLARACRPTRFNCSSVMFPLGCVCGNSCCSRHRYFTRLDAIVFPRQIFSARPGGCPRYFFLYAFALLTRGAFLRFEGRRSASEGRCGSRLTSSPQETSCWTPRLSTPLSPPPDHHHVVDLPADSPRVAQQCSSFPRRGQCRPSSPFWRGEVRTISTQDSRQSHVSTHVLTVIRTRVDGAGEDPKNCSSRSID